MSKTNTIKASNSTASVDVWEFEIANQVPARCSAKDQGLKNTSVNITMNNKMLEAKWRYYGYITCICLWSDIARQNMSMWPQGFSL